MPIASRGGIKGHVASREGTRAKASVFMFGSRGKKRRSYLCVCPFQWGTILGTVGGICIFVVGASVCFTGYFSLSFISESHNNGTHLWVAKKPTTYGKVLSHYVGPIIMGIGCFIALVACVVLCERRDLVIKDLYEEEEKERLQRAKQRARSNNTVYKKVMARIKEEKEKEEKAQGMIEGQEECNNDDVKALCIDLSSLSSPAKIQEKKRNGSLVGNGLQSSPGRVSISQGLKTTVDVFVVETDSPRRADPLQDRRNGESQSPTCLPQSKYAVVEPPEDGDTIVAISEETKVEKFRKESVTSSQSSIREAVTHRGEGQRDVTAAPTDEEDPMPTKESPPSSHRKKQSKGSAKSSPDKSSPDRKQTSSPSKAASTTSLNSNVDNESFNNSEMSLDDRSQSPKTPAATGHSQQADKSAMGDTDISPVEVTYSSSPCASPDRVKSAVPFDQASSRLTPLEVRPLYATHSGDPNNDVPATGRSVGASTLTITDERDNPDTTTPRTNTTLLTQTSDDNARDDYLDSLRNTSVSRQSLAASSEFDDEMLKLDDSSSIVNTIFETSRVAPMKEPEATFGFTKSQMRYRPQSSMPMSVRNIKSRTAQRPRTCKPIMLQDGSKSLDLTLPNLVHQPLEEEDGDL